MEIFQDKEKLNLVSEELISLALTDQEMTIGSQKKDPIPFDPELRKRNTERLKQIIDQIGWPTIEKVGEVASYAAWYIAQHSDHDLSFQEKCLDMMEKLEEGDIDRTNLAYLTDRVLVAQGKKQKYGTQLYKNETGEIVPRPIEDETKIEILRAETGLRPYSVQLLRLKDIEHFKDEPQPMVGPFFKAL